MKTAKISPLLNRYRKICGDKTIELLQSKANALAKKHIVFISSTYEGGGVAEILHSFIALLNDMGVKIGWRILHGTHDFFVVTKKFHNSLQGDKIDLSDRKKKLYRDTNENFSSFTHLKDHDLVVVHDPQPLPLIDFYKKEQPWIFRCHIDLSNPAPNLWSYLKKYIKKYDRIVVSKSEYYQDLKIPCSIIPPAIDPLSVKNHPLTNKTIKKYLDKYGISLAKPMIAQVSRFDKWKDQPGVIKIFEKVRKKVNCSLVLLGSLATDDPEGEMMYKKILKEVEKSKYKSDIKILLVNSDVLVNCIQRTASVIIQKSTREGFGLVVAEALYKGTPVVASKVGGIPLQVIDGFNGFLLEPYDYQGFANKIVLLLKDEKLRLELGANGVTHVKDNFLITRLLLDWLNLFEKHLITKSKKPTYARRNR